MGIVKCRGIILSEAVSKEADKTLTVFTKELGKIRVFVKGARNLKSRYFSCARQFNYCDFVLFSGNGFYSVTQIDKVEGFKGIATDYDKICYGNYFLELADKSILDNELNESLLRLLLVCLKLLSGGKVTHFIIARVFEYKLMDILGYRPNTIDCTSCGKPLFEGEIYFSNEGALCPVCGKRSPAAVIVNKASLNAISYILDSDLKEAFSFKLNRETAGYVKRAADMLLLNIDATIISKRMTDEIDEEAIIRKF